MRTTYKTKWFALKKEIMTAPHRDELLMRVELEPRSLAFSTATLPVQGVRAKAAFSVEVLAEGAEAEEFA